MTSYLNALSSHVSKVKGLLTQSNEQDHDYSVNDVNDSHVSRTLRAYYTEKKRPFPEWLGPDPRRPNRNVEPSYSYSGQSKDGATAYSSQQAGRAGGGGLGDLFGSKDKSRDADLAGGIGNMSLRANARMGRGDSSTSTYQGNPSSSASSTSQSTTNSFAPSPAGARPLPSQRMGSSQNRYESGPSSQPINPSAGQSGDTRFAPNMAAQQTPTYTSSSDRLKARLGGSRQSPGLSGTQSGNSSSYNPYEQPMGRTRSNVNESGYSNDPMSGRPAYGADLGDRYASQERDMSSQQRRGAYMNNEYDAGDMGGRRLLPSNPRQGRG